MRPITIQVYHNGPESIYATYYGGDDCDRRIPKTRTGAKTWRVSSRSTTRRASARQVWRWVRRCLRCQKLV